MATATMPAVVPRRGEGSKRQAVRQLWTAEERRSVLLPTGDGTQAGARGGAAQMPLSGEIRSRDLRGGEIGSGVVGSRKVRRNGLVEEAQMPPEEPTQRSQPQAAGETRSDLSGALGGGGGPSAMLAEQRALAELAKRCREGDASAWEQLAGSQHRRVYAICYRFTGSQSDAEDLTQETFLKMFRNLGSFDAEKGSFTTWLTTLTRNLLVDHYRRSRMERASDSLDESQDGEEDGPRRVDRLADGGRNQEQQLAGLELRAQIQEALSSLSPDLREAVILRDLQEMDYKEIAEVLGVPQGTVKSRISRGRSELARLLRRIEGQVM